MALTSLNRWKASALHLCLSALIAATVVTVMLALWYPGVYFDAMGGQTLLLLIVGVDVTLGPLLTLIVFDLKKPLPTLRRDLAVIAAFQLVALSYGIWITFGARPVFTAYVKDRFEVVAANDLDANDLAAAAPEYRGLSLIGPRIVGVRLPTDPNERNELLFSAVAGRDAQLIPKYYAPYADVAADAIAHAQPIASLVRRYPDARPQVDALAAEARVTDSILGYVPVRGRGRFLTAVIDLRDGRLAAILPYNPY